MVFPITRSFLTVVEETLWLKLQVKADKVFCRLCGCVGEILFQSGEHVCFPLTAGGTLQEVVYVF